MNNVLDLVYFTDKLKGIEQRFFSEKGNRSDVLPLALIAEKQKIKLPDILKYEPFYLLSKNNERKFTSSFRVYAKDEKTLGVCNCFNMPIKGVSIDSLMIGSNYQIKSYAECSINNLRILVPLFHGSPKNINFGDSEYKEIRPTDVPDNFIKGINHLYYVSENDLPTDKIFSITGTLRDNGWMLLSCFFNKCYWIVAPKHLNTLMAYIREKDQIKSFLTVKDKMTGLSRIVYQ